MQFAKRAGEILSNCTSSIIYTDFIADIGPIVSALQDQEGSLNWKTDEVKVIVATKALIGMVIDISEIRHVIRNGVPKSMLYWAQGWLRWSPIKCDNNLQ